MYLLKKTLLFLTIFVVASTSSYAMVTEDALIPMQVKGMLGAKRYELAAYIHKPDKFDPARKYPVVIISHGTATDCYTRTHTRFDYKFVSRYFIGKGFVAVVPMRRGYAGSDGASIADNIGSCSRPDYVSSAREGARDIAAVISYVKGLSYIDANSILLVGTSSGGFTSLAAASLNIDGVIGVINFSGGQGGLSGTVPAGHACDEESLVRVMGSFGKAKVPTLWIYSEDDAFFGPELAHAMFGEFVRNGGDGRLVIIPPCGHKLISKEETINMWSAYSDEYLNQLKPGREIKIGFWQD